MNILLILFAICNFQTLLMSHHNSFPTLISISQQMNQAHFQITASSQMQHNAVVNSQILFPQCQQTLSVQPVQNGNLTPNRQINNDNKQIQQNRQFQQQLTIPLQLGAGNHAIATAGIPLDLSYFVQGGCLPNCLPIQLTSPGGLQQGFQTTLNCVNTSSNDQQQTQVSQSDTSTGNSFLQFNVAYQPQSFVPTIQTIVQTSTNDNTSAIIGSKSQPKRKKKTVNISGILGKSSEKLSTGNNAERFHSVAVQTDFDMSLCRQQIVVVPPKNCTCVTNSQGLESGVFKEASFPPGSHRNDKRMKRNFVNKLNNLQYGEIQKSEPVSQSQVQSDQLLSSQEQISLVDQCNGGQPNCDNRGRPFTYECLYCPKRFSLHSRLVAHLRCHTGMRPFSCLQCGYSFTQRSYLNRHAAVHKQERPFSCLACHKTYKHYGSLANHRKLHSKSTLESSVNETSEISEAVLPPPVSSTNTAISQQLFTTSSSLIPSQMFGSQMFPTSTPITSLSSPQMFYSSSTLSSSSVPQQMFQVSSTIQNPTSQMFPPASQSMTTFYQPHDASGFLLSLNASAAPSTGAANTMFLFHPSNNSITVPSTSSSSNSNSAYVPILTSSAFS